MLLGSFSVWQISYNQHCATYSLTWVWDLANLLGRWATRVRPANGHLSRAKFHYASWFEVGRRPALNLSATSFEPDSVMEFGFYAPISIRRLLKQTVLGNFSNIVLAVKCNIILEAAAERWISNLGLDNQQRQLGQSPAKTLVTPMVNIIIIALNGAAKPRQV